MPRKPRELVDGGIYHVFNRGNDRMDLFGDENDFQCFLDLLLIQKRKTESDLFHYCLMTNHFHLLVKVKRGNDLPLFMHGLQLAYTRYFKKKYQFLGHLFQQRFKSSRIEEESYFLQCGRYIERNPLKAHLVKECADYKYSSARFYVEGSKNELITLNPYYLSMGSSDKERQEHYRQFILIDEPYSQLVDEALSLA